MPGCAQAPAVSTLASWPSAPTTRAAATTTAMCASSPCPRTAPTPPPPSWWVLACLGAVPRDWVVLPYPGMSFCLSPGCEGPWTSSLPACTRRAFLCNVLGGPGPMPQPTVTFCLPASPSLSRQAGMTIVPVGVDAKGNINIAELKQKAEQHKCAACPETKCMHCYRELGASRPARQARRQCVRLVGAPVPRPASHCLLPAGTSWRH